MPFIPHFILRKLRLWESKKGWSQKVVLGNPSPTTSQLRTLGNWCWLSGPQLPWLYNGDGCLDISR